MQHQTAKFAEYISIIQRRAAEIGYYRGARAPVYICHVSNAKWQGFGILRVSFHVGRLSTKF
jgi:hypothetical protein